MYADTNDIHTYRLITVTVFPYARSPYGRILLYTPMCSRHLTMARGVQGKMDLTVPAGGWSSTVVGVEFWMVVERRVWGLRYRMLGYGYIVAQVSGVE